jgi:hypothetical protein
VTEIDWSSLQKEAASAGVLPVGSYNVVVTESSATVASTGKPMIKVKLRVTEGPHKDKPIWNQFVISAESPIALRIFFQHMAAFGLNTDFFAANPSTESVASNLLNRAATVELGIRQWQGADRNEVKSVNPLTAGGPLAPGVVTGPPVPAAQSGSPSSVPTSPVASPANPPAATPTAPPVPPTGAAF